jgi:hypothetical protein
MSAATLLAVGVTILCAGWLWFYIVRPILEDFGWITDGETVNTSQDRARAVMSRSEDSTPLYSPYVPPVVATFTAAEQPIATPNNEYSGGLSNNERAAFETTAKSIAAMYQKGVITNLSKAICAAYGCTVQSAAKTDSTYQMALKAVNKYLPNKNTPQFRMTPEQEAAREALGLDRAF